MSRLLFALMLCAALPAGTAEAQSCTGRFVNPISDVCWQCLFPISIGPIRMGSTAGVPDIPQQKDTVDPFWVGLDVVRMARNGELDVAILFSQDQDLAEVAREVRDISRSAGRWLKVVSALAHGPRATSSRGIDRTDWFRMDREFYDACLDPGDYRPRR